MKKALIFYWLIFPFFAVAQSTQSSTYCNPVNIDYTYMIYNANEGLSYRSGADPAVVKFKNEYYLFVTRLFYSALPEHNVDNRQNMNRNTLIHPYQKK